MMFLLWLILAFLKVVVALTALSVLLSFTVAWYERANTRPDLIGQRFTLRGVGTTLWLLTQEFATLLITIILRPFGWGHTNIHKDIPVNHRPIILLHGLFQNRSCLYWLKFCLKRAGYRHVYTLNTPPWHDLDTLTERLVKQIDELRVALKVDQVDLVGHSMGGMIGRNYVQKRGGAARVAHLVTLGAPHHGSKLAPFAVSAMGLSLLPESPFLNEINNSEWPEETGFTSIYSRYDNIVLPASSSRMASAINVELDGMGHTSLLFHPRAMQAVIDALAEPKA